MNSGGETFTLNKGIQTGLSLVNLGLLPATTTNANDSIKLSGQLAALSAANVAYLTLMSTVTAGRQVVFPVTADVTINLTGAHWGQGTKGDLPATAFLRLFAINDAGTLKWGVGYVGGRTSVVDTDTSITGTNITAPEFLLVNTALTAGTWPCKEVGFFYATFDDTGGAAEDLWAVQTGASQLVMGQTGDGIWQPFGTTITGFGTPPTWTSLSWVGNQKSITIQADKNASGVSNATTITFELPVKAALVTTGMAFEIVNNGASIPNNAGVVQARVSSVVADVFLSVSLAGWSANVSAKGCSFFITYPAL